LNEQNIIQACRQNNVAAQHELYNKYCAMILGICYRYANTRNDAEDMMQESFVKIFRDLPSYNNQGSLASWMKTVVVHSCLNYITKHKKYNYYLDIEEAHFIEVDNENIFSKIRGQQVIEAIRMLPVNYRTVLNLFAIEGYSHKEIGNMLGFEEATSRSLYFRAKNNLEKILIKKQIINDPNSELHWQPNVAK
jgi:RNA polymerase sigma factor (sigma-70 family)